MTTYNALKTLIINNRYTYDDMFAKLDVFCGIGRIDKEQYIELTGLLVKPDHIEGIDPIDGGDAR